MEDTCWNRFTLKDCCLWKRPVLEQICPEGLQCVGRSSSRNELLWTDHNPCCICPCTAWGGRGGRKVRTEALKLREGQRRKGKKHYFNFCLCFSPSSSITTGNSQFNVFCLTVIDEGCPISCFICFCSPLWLREGELNCG